MSENTNSKIIDQHSPTKSRIVLLGDEGVGKKLLISNIYKKLQSTQSLNNLLQFEIWNNEG